MAAIIGFLSGIISGMGIGGGAILIPALSLLCGAEQKTAQGINLIYFIPTAVIALIVHIKNKRVDLKAALIIGLCGIVGAIGGSWLAVRLSDELLRKIFGGFLLFVGAREVYGGLKVKN